jgi:hypothetical protein
LYGTALPQTRAVEVEVLAMRGCAAEEAMLATVDAKLAAELAASAASAAATPTHASIERAWAHIATTARTDGDGDRAGGDDGDGDDDDDELARSWSGMEENVDAERARHKQCLALVRAVPLVG